MMALFVRPEAFSVSHSSGRSLKSWITKFWDRRWLQELSFDLWKLSASSHGFQSFLINGKPNTRRRRSLLSSIFFASFVIRLSNFVHNFLLFMVMMKFLHRQHKWSYGLMCSHTSNFLHSHGRQRASERAEEKGFVLELTSSVKTDARRRRSWICLHWSRWACCRLGRSMMNTFPLNSGWDVLFFFCDETKKT